jgi:hypothetical protein
MNKPTAREIIAAIFADDDEMTDAEVETELADSGVDVPAFIAKVKARIKEVDDN